MMDNCLDTMTPCPMKLSTFLIQFIVITGSLYSLNGQTFTSCEWIEGIYVCYAVPEVNGTWDEGFSYCGTLSSLSGADSDSVLARVYTKDLQARLEEFLGNNSITDEVWISASTENPVELDGNPASQWRWVYNCSRCDTSMRAAMLKQYGLNQQGCYSDSETNRDLQEKIPGDGFDPVTCQQRCADHPNGYIYAALQTGDMVGECRCGDKFGSYDPSNGCTERGCSGDPFQENCGGNTRNFVYKDDGMFGSWGFGQPDNVDPDLGGSEKQYCAAAKLGDGPYFRHFDFNCAQPYPFLCSYSTTGPCDSTPGPGFYHTTTNGTCVYLSRMGDATTWYNARQYCRDSGGDLVILNSAFEHVEVMEFALSHLGGGSNVYTGIHRNPLVWKRVYQDAEMNYYNFATDQPLFTGSSRSADCMYIDPLDSYKWKIDSCDTDRKFICFEGPVDDPAPVSTASPTTTESENTGPTKGTGPTDTTPRPTATTPTGPGGPEETTTSLFVGSTPGQSTDPGGLTQTEKILIGTLTTVGILLIVFLILFLVCRKQQRDEKARVAPSPKDKVDARLKATQPESGPIWDVNEGYHDMGSTTKLIFAVKKLIVPKWRTKAKASSRSEPDAEPETNPDMLRRRTSDTESVLVPDLLQPMESFNQNAVPPETLGRYEYMGDSPGVLGESPQGSRTALITSYSSVPQPLGAEHRPSIPGQTDFEFAQGSLSVASASGIADFRTLEDGVDAQPEDLDDPGSRLDATRSETNVHRGSAMPNVDVDSVQSEPAQEVEEDLESDVELESHISDDDSKSVEEDSPRGSDAPLVRPADHKAKPREVRPPNIDADNSLAAVAI